MDTFDEFTLISSKAKNNEIDEETKFKAKLLEYEYITGYNSGLEFTESHLSKNNLEFIEMIFSENVKEYLNKRNLPSIYKFPIDTKDKSSHYLKGEVKGMIDADKLLSGNLKLDKLLVNIGKSAANTMTT